MMEPNPLTRFDAPWMRELRHLAALNGWVHADYFDGEFAPIRDQLAGAGNLEPGRNGNAATYQLTDAGRAWCDQHGAA